jgi:hypothetical protein
MQAKDGTMNESSVNRKTVAWGLAALVAAMVADLAETLIDPANSGKGAEIVSAATAHHARMVVAGLLLLASAAFVLPGVYVLTRMLDRRGRHLARAAVVLGLLGTLGHAALGGIYLVWSAMPGSSGGHAELIAGIDRASNSASLAPLAVLFIAFPLGLVTTFVAMVRGRLAPRWVLVPALAAPAAAIAAIGADPAPTVTALVCLLVASAALAVSLLGRPGAEREARPAPVLA